MITEWMPRFHPRYLHRILYVGHDHSLSKFLRDKLKIYQIIGGPNGSLARTFIDKISYSLLLFDENLSDTTGLMLASFTRSLKHRELTPIIILSENRCKRAGVIFNRPNEFELLVRTIKNLLET